MFSLPTILSFAPFLVFIFLLLVKKASLWKTSFITLLLFTALGLLYWKMVPAYLLFSYVKGFFLAFDIFIIIFGAIFFLRILEDLKIIQNISCYLERFSKDYRVQIIILAWLFENLLEGTAGFGIPAAIVVPLLVGLGLPPIRALIVGLLGNSTAGAFGAAGTPIRVGFAGLDITAVPQLAAMISCVGFLVPVFMLWIITSGRLDRKKEFFEGLPFAIWSGVVFVISSLVTVGLGQEFPSILGSAIALFVIFISTRLGFFMPKEIRSFHGERILKSTMSPGKAFLPYGLLILFLIAGKIILGTSGISIAFQNISHTFSFFNPGFTFLLTGCIVAVFWRSHRKKLHKSTKSAFFGALNPFFVIVFMSTIVQILIQAGNNTSGFSAPILYIVKIFESSWLPFFAPFIGAFGSFVTGSVTISNIMFGNFFSVAAQTLVFPAGMILALGLTGAAAGNMIALADILAASAVLGVKNEERKILRGVIGPCVIYLILLGVLGLLIT